MIFLADLGAVGLILNGVTQMKREVRLPWPRFLLRRPLVDLRPGFG